MLRNGILLKNDKVVDFLTRPPTDFPALKMFQLQHQFNDVKFKTVAEKTAKNFRGLLYFAAPC